MGRIVFALLLILSTRLALACSCAPAASAPACEQLSIAEVAFIGTVRSLEPEPGTPGVYRMNVEVAYKGLPEGIREVVVDPGSFATCRTNYKSDQRYLMFVRKTSSGRVQSDMCSGSRSVESATDDMRFLEAYSKHEALKTVKGLSLDSRDRTENSASTVFRQVRTNWQPGLSHTSQVVFIAKSMCPRPGVSNRFRNSKRARGFRAC
jgi:hypothetical protein